ncbi:MAG: hypothetical protein JNK33_04645 [Candidatus Doudnabacteria bacterium]|nr:hypothetical protein [Candidatus Doudnabacteria bacterium]
MTKNQKLWFWIGLALFAIPEILWSPVVNVFYDLFQSSNSVAVFRDNLLTSGNHVNLFISILGLQLFGLLVSERFVLRSQQSLGLKIAWSTVLGVLVLATLLAWSIVFSLRRGITI